MDQCDLILTDSGGIQEEGPSLGKPVLVMRGVTERPEAVDAGTVILVGTNQEKIVEGVEKVLLDSEVYLKMSKAHNPYGDGNAVEKIIATLHKAFSFRNSSDWDSNDSISSKSATLSSTTPKCVA